jgi:hypothetical protein
VAALGVAAAPGTRTYEPHWTWDGLLDVWIVFALVDLFARQLILRAWWAAAEWLAGLL